MADKKEAKNGKINNLMELSMKFDSEQACRKYFATLRWPDDYDGEFTSAWDIAVRCDSRPLIKALKDALDVVIEKDKKHK